MKWLGRFFRRRVPERNATVSDSAPKKSNTLSVTSDPQLAILSLRLEVLLLLIQRWPHTEKDIENWDRVAAKTKSERSNPITAGIELDINFSPGFWFFALGSAIYNL